MGGSCKGGSAAFVPFVPFVPFVLFVPSDAARYHTALFMTEAPNIDEVLRTSDDVAVRRRFDSRNLVSLFLIVCGFVVVSLIEATADLENRDALDLAIASTNFLLSCIVIFLLRDAFRVFRSKDQGMWKAGHLLRAHVSATVIIYMVVQYTLCLAFARDDGWMGWSSFFPFLLLFFRMTVAEFVLVHGYFVAASTFMIFVVVQPKRNALPMLISSIMVNSIALGIVLWTSRSLRREIVTDWTERRVYAREQVRMRDELQYAREVQLAMLPDSAPQLDWVDLAGLSLPATEVGGDYYDYFVEGNRVAVVCGDVAGHGLASGLVLVALRSGFTLLRDELQDPAHVLTRLHDLVAQTSRRRMLATVAMVLLDRDAMRAIVASAGHPPVIFRRDGTIRTLELFAPPLGVRLPVHIPKVELDLAPGDVFLLHSDGVYEARNADDEIYGLDRLAELVRSHPPDATAEELRDDIAHDLETFRGSTAFDDDVTLVVAKVR